MLYVFHGAGAFNQSIGDWMTASVTACSAAPAWSSTNIGMWVIPTSASATQLLSLAGRQEGARNFNQEIASG